MSEHNQLRLRNEMDLAVSRGLRMVLALGAVATRTVTDLLGPRPRTPTAWDAVEVVGLPHPSAQGLLSAAPDRGRGARLADLATAWERDVAERVRAALAEQA